MRVLFLSPNAALPREVAGLAPEMDIHAALPAEAAGALRARAYDVLVLADWSPEALAATRQRHGAVRLLAVASTPSAEIARNAVRLRASDVLFASSPAEIAHALRTLPPDPAYSATGRAEFSGSTIALISPHGGAGRTTLGVNLALALADDGPSILWDCVPWYGVAHIALDLAPGTAASEIRAMDPEELDGLLIGYEQTAMRLLPAPSDVHAAASMAPDVVESVMGGLLRLARWVVIDTERVVTPGIQTVLERADLIVVLTRLTVASVRNLRAYLDGVLRPYPPEKVLLVGAGLPRAPLSARHVGDLAGISLEHILPYDPAVLRADAEGRPTLLAAPRSPYSQAVWRLAHLVIERLSRTPVTLAG